MLELVKDPSAWAAAISFVAMAVSVGFSFSATRAAKRNLEHQDALVQIERFRLEQEQRERVKGWADEVLGSMQAGIDHTALAESVAGSDAERVRIAGKLSELIDRGRWLFENATDTEHGRWKESAYRGFRPEILDVVVDAYRIVEPKRDTSPIDGASLVKKKRAFVSQVQSLVKPSRAREELEKAVAGSCRADIS